MNLTREDIRAAVSAGTISDMQATNLIALAETRAGIRARIGGHDEPFELFSGFNEVFIILGLGVIFLGWFGTSISLFESGAPLAIPAALGLIGLVVLAFMARYFTLRRRMNGPSSTLAMLFAYCAGQLGLSIALYWTSEIFLLSGITASVVAIGMIVYWVLFRVPFALFLISGGLFAASFCFVALADQAPQTAGEIFQLSATGLYGWVTIILGLAALVVAMAFDMSDPHRVTRRAINGFWLHVVAAPAIVNTVALTLFLNGSVMSVLGLVLFLVVLTGFALVIDRRSFLIAGAGYVAALAYQVVPGVFFISALFLGVSLVVLGAHWERLRGWMMERLPDFPGKSRLPPWMTVAQDIALPQRNSG